MRQSPCTDSVGRTHSRISTVVVMGERVLGFLLIAATVLWPMTSRAAAGWTVGSEGVSDTGSATYRIGLAAPPGVNNLSPSLALTYDSRSGNGITGEYKLGWPSKLPDWKGEWKENAGRLREAMRQGGPIRDVSPDDLGGPFLNAERNLLRDRGWTYDPRTNYWNPPGP